MSWKTHEGSPSPLGCIWVGEEDAYNFALFARHADAVRLLLYRPDDAVNPVFTCQLDPLMNKSDDIWHCRVSHAEADGALGYAYHVESSPAIPDGGGVLFPVGKELLDPYARQLFIPDAYDRACAIGPGSNRGQAMMGQLPPAIEESFDWGDDWSPHHERELLVYEVHVKGFTRNPNSGVPEADGGCYLGLIQKIPHLVELGVTCVELMPVCQFELHSVNYWGYMPVSFFSPHCGFASGAAGARSEFRRMVKALHAANIEVILDVVYNHTAEAGADGPCYGMKGIDSLSYYLTEGHPPVVYSDFSGTGNTLNCANRAVRRMLMDSLRYWVKEMHVDGFRFDLASVFSRKEDGSIDTEDPPLFAEIAADPDLGGVRLIAEPWDAGGAYQLGKNFPGLNWFQWNGCFRDDIKRFVRGEGGLVPRVMTRIYGSDDLFPGDVRNSRHPYQSVNYIASHDGLTLYDTVAYNERHNDANGSNNTDGPSDNLSWNCGFEGEIGASHQILALRRQQVKNFCAILMLANGTPMIRMGDEFLQTQHGNSNPWNQDNLTTWLDWQRLAENRDMFRFFRKMIVFRNQHDICRSRFWREHVHWYGIGAHADLGPESRSLAYFLAASDGRSDDLYVMLNLYWEGLTFEIQESGAWKIEIDTARPSPADIVDAHEAIFLPSPACLVHARSIVVATRTRE
jgi:glycogen operon protein